MEWIDENGVEECGGGTSGVVVLGVWYMRPAMRCREQGVKVRF